MISKDDLPILDDLDSLLRILCKTTGQDAQTIALKLLNEHLDVGSNVRSAMVARKLAFYQWTEELNEFYDSTDAFLFETIVWNRSALKKAMRTWISESIARRFEGPIRILCFGDGLGLDSLYFAMKGHHVDFYEVSERSKKFATELFSVTDVKVQMIADLGDLKVAYYDVILLLDVLEHVHLPELCVAMLAKSLRPHGYLYTHSPFWLLTPSVTTHLAENQKYSGDLGRLFTAHQLRPSNARLLWNPIELQKCKHWTVFRRPLTASLRIWLGGYLLWWGRNWNAPHIAAVKYLFSSKHSRWRELENFIAREKPNEPS